MKTIQTAALATVAIPLCIIVLAGCSGPGYFLEKNAGAAPTRLTVHIEPILVQNLDDLRDDLKLDSVGLREWVKPFLAERLSKYSGIDTIVWDDSMATVPWTATAGRWTIPASRPADSAADGWTLVLGNGWTGRSRRPTSVVGGVQMYSQSLDMGMSYTLVERRTGRNLAYGFTTNYSSFTFAMGKGEWEEVTRSTGWDIGRRLPKTATAQAKADRAQIAADRKPTAANRRP